MVIRKITIDNSVKYVPIVEKDMKQNTTKNKKIQPISGGGKQNKKILKNLLKNLQLVDLEYLQNSMYMYKIL